MLRQSIVLTVTLGLLLFWVPAQSGSAEMGKEDGAVVEDEAREASEDGAIVLTVEVEGENVEMKLSDYLVGVVAAEMPAAFEAEALKAQTTAARTYTLYQMAHGSGEKHSGGADLCDDPLCCQAYLGEERLRENWGAAAEENLNKIAAAEEATDGYVILYGGEPILAVFHSSSAYGTEDAAAAWSASVPYLQRVESPEEEGDVPNYRSTVRFTAEEFRTLFSGAYPEGKLKGSCEKWIGEMVRDSSGYVLTLRVGDCTLRGVELRRMLGLRSASFDVEAEKDALTFTTLGYGHGVGMSQYGANALAAAGKSWEEILRWYYSGVSIERYSA